MSAKKVIALLSLVLFVGFGFYRLDYHDLSFGNNTWQYIMIIIAFLGSVSIFVFDNVTSSTRKKYTIIVWILTIICFLYTVISGIVKKEVDWLLLLSTTLILACTTLSYLGNRISDNADSSSRE